MSTTINTNIGMRPVKSEPKVKVTPEQEKHRVEEAQNLIKRLESLLIEGENPGTEIISDALLKAEALILQISQRPDVDPQAVKTLEDISAMFITAKQMSRNKGLAERLQVITDETQKALEETRQNMKVSPTKALSTAVETAEWISNWRPLFYLMVNSRDFRKLLLDSIRIIRSIAYRYAFTDETTQKFIEGEPVKDIANDVKEDIKEDVDEKGSPDMSDEEWERLQEDVQRVLVLLCKEPSYRQGIDRIFGLLDLFQRSMATSTPATTPVVENIHVRRAVLETEELVASFSGRETFENFKFQLRNIVTKIQQNENLQAYLFELKEFVLSAKSEEEIQSQEFKDKSKDLAKRGRYVMREFKEEDLNPFFQSADDLIENIKNDEFLSLLRTQAGIIQSDLSYVDTEGIVQVDTDMLSKLQKAILPVLADALKYIPVPRIYSCDKNREFWLDKIVLCSYDIIPENIRFHLESDSELSFRDIEVKETQTYLVIELNRLLTEIKDVEFWYKKKTFPELEDSGRVTFRVKGNGARLRLTYYVVQKPEDTVPRIMDGNAIFDISDLEIEFDKSTLKHDVLVPMLTNMFKLQIKQQMEYQVESNLKGWMKNLGDMISNSLSETNRPLIAGLQMAKQAVKSSQIGQIYEKRREMYWNETCKIRT